MCAANHRTDTFAGLTPKATAINIYYFRFRQQGRRRRRRRRIIDFGRHTLNGDYGQYIVHAWYTHIQRISLCDGRS